MVKICVLGAGVVGLSTAVNIQNLIPHASITIIADRFDIDTTSDGSAGIFRPTVTHTPGIPKDQYFRWLKTGFKRYSDLALSEESASSGVSVSHGYMFNNAQEDLSLRNFVFSFHELTPDEIKKFKVPYKYGYLLATCLVECRKYQPWLTKSFQDRGGVLKKRKINNLHELVDEFDIVVNCTGFNSRYLLNDEKVYPVRGQVLRVDAPWMKHFVCTDDTIYIYPTSESVVIGGVRQKDNFNTQVDPADSKRILERAINLWPGIKGVKIGGSLFGRMSPGLISGIAKNATPEWEQVAELMLQNVNMVGQLEIGNGCYSREKNGWDLKVKWAWAGLRPHRIPIRVEKETMEFPNGSLPVVHNYGHGANGVALSWGTSLDAAALVKDTVEKIKIKSKL